MRAPRAPTVVLVVLAMIGLSAAGIGWYCVTRAQVLSSTHEVAAAKIDALVERASRLDAAFESFESQGVEYSWFTATSRLVEDLHARAAELDSALPGVAMAPRARLAEDLQRVRETVDGARANLDAGRTLMALDVMESNGKPASAAVGAELPALRAAVAAKSPRCSGAGGKAWRARAGRGPWPGRSAFCGLRGAACRRRASKSGRRCSASPSLAESGAVEAARSCSAGRPAGAGAGRGGRRCERIGRVRDASELPDLLEEAAAVLHADGLVLWTRDADGLVVGAAHGYPDSVAQRLGRVPLADENLITGPGTAAGAGRRPRTLTRAGAPRLPRRSWAPPVLLVFWRRSCRRTRTSVRLLRRRGLSRHSSPPCSVKRPPTPTRMPATRPLYAAPVRSYRVIG